MLGTMMTVLITSSCDVGYMMTVFITLSCDVGYNDDSIVRLLHPYFVLLVDSLYLGY